MAFFCYVLLSVIAGVLGTTEGGWNQMGCWLLLFWPVYVPHLWWQRQAKVWKAPPVQVQAWQRQDLLGRRVWHLGKLTLLFRWMDPLDAPVLLSRSELVLTPLVCRLRICWQTRP